MKYTNISGKMQSYALMYSKHDKNSDQLLAINEHEGKDPRFLLLALDAEM
jgi:hypothetical protein